MIEDKIIEILTLITMFTEEKLQNNLNTEKLWDSMNMLEIVIALEDEFDITFTQDEIASMTTISKINEIIKGKVNEA